MIFSSFNIVIIKTSMDQKYFVMGINLSATELNNVKLIIL